MVDNGSHGMWVKVESAFAELGGGASMAFTYRNVIFGWSSGSRNGEKNVSEREREREGGQCAC